MKNLFKFGVLGLALTFTVAACNNPSQNEENTETTIEEVETQLEDINENIEEATDSLQNEVEEAIDSLENVQ